MTYRKYNTYGQLRTVVLGSYFLPEYFRTISNSKVREPLMRMSEEVHEDLENFSLLLKQCGCTVIRPETIVGEFNAENVIVPPIMVRDRHAVIGNKLYHLVPDFHHALTPILKNYCNDIVDIVDSNCNFYDISMAAAISNYNQDKDLWYSKSKYLELAGSSWPAYEDFVRGIASDDLNIQKEMLSFKQVLEYETKELGPMQAPNIINTDDCIYVDANEYCDYVSWAKSNIQDPRPIQQFTSKAGHVDGCFAVLGKKVILGIDPLIDYKKYFPDYQVVRIPTESYIHPLTEFYLMREKNNGAWWLPGQEKNNEFINFVESYLKSWVGYVAESVFDVNLLVLDENTVCVSNITKDVEKQLNSFGIECILVPWRHRFFLDGGLHCITLDLYRD